MRRVCYFILGVAGIFGVAAGGFWYFSVAALPEEEGIAHLKTVSVEPFDELTGRVSPYAVSMESGRPAELLDLPSGITGTEPSLQYYHLSIGQHNVFILLQELADGTVRAWIDTNRDQHLSDEKALGGVPRIYKESRTRSGDYLDFGKIQLTNLSPFHLIRYDKRVIMAFPISYARGVIRLEDRFYRVVLIDGDFDGKFQTLYKPGERQHRGAHDAFLLDYHTTAPLGRNRFDTAKLIPLGRYFKYDPFHYGGVTSDNAQVRYYDLSISPDGQTVQMTTAEPIMGTLHIGPSKKLSVQLFSDVATQWVDIGDENVKLPVGRYQMWWGELTYSDNNGDTLKLFADFQNDVRKGIFEITEGQTVTLNPGPPFTVKTDIYKRNSSELSINVGLVGNEGEEYGLRINRSAGKPEIEIVAENGDTLHTGSMEYG